MGDPPAMGHRPDEQKAPMPRHPLQRRFSKLQALERIRAIALAIALADALATAALIMPAPSPLPTRIAGALAAIALSVYWIKGFRRQTFPLAGEPFEAALAFLVLHAAPGNPFLPLCAILYRSTYFEGGVARTVGRYALWMLALFAAHATRGSAQIQGDLARALGLGTAPIVMRLLALAMAKLQASERRLASLVQHSSDIVTVVGEDLRVRWQADSLQRVLEQDPGALLAQPLSRLIHPDDYWRLERYVEASRGRRDFALTFELRLLHGDGSYRQFEIVACNRLHDESVRGLVLNMRDATERLRLEAQTRALAEQLEHDATHDPLTGLANRRALFGTLASAIAEASQRGVELTVLLLDLDRFKELNDTLGHAAGDQLLRELRPRLLDAARDADLIARFGGDEFAVLLPLGAGSEEGERIAALICAAIEKHFVLDGLCLSIRASMGIAVFPHHGSSAEALLQHADVAMYCAKANGAGFEIYNRKRDAHSRERLALLGELPAAIGSGQLVLHYQPKVALASGCISGVEAMLRWEHPRLGLLAPSRFLPLAEQAGLMRELTLETLERALAQCATWRECGLDLPVAVNLAAPNLLDASLAPDISALLARLRLDPSALVLEITETIIAADPRRVREVLAQLRELDITLSLDDFGTGSSSLAFLRELPVQELKIDRSFIADVTSRDGAITRMIIDLARHLGLRTVAEGIEDADTLAQIVSFGADAVQGFFFARPLPAAEMTALANSWVPRSWSTGPGRARELARETPRETPRVRAARRASAAEPIHS
jgi:diguanylate cyclase (GGDEF)-like protein/PAS domain S-box-containing protein